MKALTSILIALPFLLLLLGCQGPSRTKNVKSLNPKDHGMRHGWTIFTGPKRTVVDVNDAGSIERGGRLYEKYCQKCHGKTGMGDGPLADVLDVKPAKLALSAKTLPNYYLVMQINTGGSGMPRWEDYMSVQESWDVSNYVKTLAKKKK